MTRTRARIAGLLAGAAVLLDGPPAAAQPGPSDEFRGFLTAAWGDPPPGATGSGGLRFTLTAPDGTRVPVEFAPALRTAAEGLAGERVLIRGGTAGHGGDRRIVARSVEAAAGGERRPAR